MEKEEVRPFHGLTLRLAYLCDGVCFVECVGVLVCVCYVLVMNHRCILLICLAHNYSTQLWAVVVEVIGRTCVTPSVLSCSQVDTHTEQENKEPKYKKS